VQQADLIVVGAGIVGLAHALSGVRRGKRVLVLDRDAQANGASIRNFGFVTVTGQERGAVWQLARHSAAIWREVAPQAGIAVEQEGLLLVAQRHEAAEVLDAFLATEMGEGCTRVTQAQLQAEWPMVRDGREALWSPHDLRVESYQAVPRLARWLAEAHGVTFCFGTAVLGVESGAVHTHLGRFEAETVIVCPGDDWASLFPELYAQANITRCKLQMLRLAAPGWRLPSPVMSDLSMVRYLGYSALSEAAVLRARLEHEEAAALADGVHLIAVQSADGTLVVGDSHHYGATPDPFASEAVDRVILDAYAQVLGDPPAVVSRWTGTYASGAGHHFIATPADGVRLVVVTSGTGASTGFGLAERVMAQVYGSEP
jgi:FAD dependent oxidoreductase TIGR03364